MEHNNRVDGNFVQSFDKDQALQYDTQAGELVAFKPFQIFTSSTINFVAVIKKALELEGNDTAVVTLALCEWAKASGHSHVDLKALPTMDFSIPLDGDLTLEDLHQLWPHQHEDGSIDWEIWVALLKETPGLCYDPLAHTSDKGIVVIEDSRVYLRNSYEMEIRVAEAIANRLTHNLFPRNPHYVDGQWENLTHLIASQYGLTLHIDLEKAISHLFAHPNDPSLVDKQQMQAAKSALTSKFTIIAGGPGTGKTATVAKIVALSMFGCRGNGFNKQPRIAISAFSGKASNRAKTALLEEIDTLQNLAESIDSFEFDATVYKQLTPVTLASLLKMGSRKGRAPVYSQHNPLPFDMIIIDELSMVSLPDLDLLLQAVHPDTHLIFVGDPNQLPSIDMGSTLQDTMQGATKAGFTHNIITLQTNYRSDKTLSQLAESIIDGNYDLLRNQLRPRKTSEPSTRFFTETVEFLEVDQLGWPLEKHVGPGFIEAMVNERKKAQTYAKQGLREQALAQSLHTVVLAFHRRGPGSVLQWNSSMDHWLGQTDASYRSTEGIAMWAGRPVMVTANDRELGVNNGDIGVMVVAQPAGEEGFGERASANGRLADPLFGQQKSGEQASANTGLAEPSFGQQRSGEPPSVNVGLAEPSFRQQRSGNQQLYSIVLDGNPVEYDPHRLRTVETVHALTVHKSQGSQFKNVVVFLGPEGSRLHNREVLYTAVTRTQENVLIVGSAAALEEAVLHSRDRFSQLDERIYEKTSFLLSVDGLQSNQQD